MIFKFFKYKKWLIYSTIAILGLVFFCILATNIPGALKMKLVEYEFVQNFIHPYHSLRKLSDIIFLPYFFTKSNLPRIYINIDAVNIVALNEALPHGSDSNPFQNTMREENKLFVRADFESDGYKDRVDIRYRGLTPVHWNAYKKSFRIDFPNDHLFRGMEDFNLVIPFDRGYYTELLNIYRARKFGLKTPEMDFVRVYLNGEDVGVYLAFEAWGKGWLSKTGLPDSGNILGSKNIRSMWFDKMPSLFLPESISSWKSYTTEEDGLSELEIFLQILNDTDDETFSRLIGTILDLDKFYAWETINKLAGSNHQSDFENITMFFDPITGKFELIPWDVDSARCPNCGTYESLMPTLTKRIFSIPELKEARDNFLIAYVKDEKNLEDDLRFFDNWLEKTKKEFFSDNAMLHSNLAYLKFVREARNAVVWYFNNAMDDLNKEFVSMAGEKSMEGFELGGEFSFLKDSVINIDEFIYKHPQFYKEDTQTIVLDGVFAFKETIVVPYGLTLKIMPGTQVYFDDGVSFVSYSRVVAEGSKYKPIKFLSLNANKPWGSFAVLNTEKKSVLKYVEAKNGSGEKINGVTVTGMIAFHNASVDIENCVFKNANDDDALNIKLSQFVVEDSIFKNNSSDALDVDFAQKGSLIDGNKFLNNGGDAIDFSYSDISISNNKIEGCGDKGISIGEKSNLVVDGHSISKCDIGIAVKDLSHAEIQNSNIFSNRIGVSLYQKKPVFGGATAILENIIFENNEIDFEKDDKSDINIR